MTYQDNPTNQSEMNHTPVAYDYTNQAWVKYGRYEPCGHTVPCDCFGRVHAGEPITPNAELA
jgi:hypothetical protein